jgi:hypothetical protein
VTRAIILGGAECVWEDLAALERMTGTWDGLVIAVNDVGIHWTRRLDHWVSLHPEKLVKRDSAHVKKWPWVRQRDYLGHPNGYQTWTRNTKKANVDHSVPAWSGGSSGLLAVNVARALDCDRVVLVGTPMDKRPHFRESIVHVKGRKWSPATAHWKKWLAHEADMQGWVRSMSGRTRDLLGEPTPEWLEGSDDG